MKFVPMLTSLQVLVDLMNELQQECHLAGFSETTSPAIFQYAVTGVKDKLLEDQLSKCMFSKGNTW